MQAVSPAFLDVSPLVTVGLVLASDGATYTSKGEGSARECPYLLSKRALASLARPGREQRRPVHADREHDGPAKFLDALHFL